MSRRDDAAAWWKSGVSLAGGRQVSGVLASCHSLASTSTLRLHPPRNNHNMLKLDWRDHNRIELQEGRYTNKGT